MCKVLSIGVLHIPSGLYIDLSMQVSSLCLIYINVTHINVSILLCRGQRCVEIKYQNTSIASNPGSACASVESNGTVKAARLFFI